MPFCCLLAAAVAVAVAEGAGCGCGDGAEARGFMELLELLVARSCAIYETALHWPRPDFWDTFGWLSQRRPRRQLRAAAAAAAEAAASVRLICDRLCVVSLRHGAWNLWHLTVNERAARPRITAVGALSPSGSKARDGIKLERWCRGSRSSAELSVGQSVWQFCHLFYRWVSIMDSCRRSCNVATLPRCPVASVLPRYMLCAWLN